MKLYSHKSWDTLPKRYVRKEHKEVSLESGSSASFQPMTDGGRMLYVSISFNADDRRFIMELTPDEARRLVATIQGHISRDGREPIQ